MESKRNIRFAAKVIALCGNKVLCVIYRDNRLNGYLDFPGGKIEPGEHEVDTCIRELREETALTADGLKYAGTVVNSSPQKVFDIQVYVSRSIRGKPYSPEGNSAIWLPLSYVRKYPKRLPVTHLIDKDKIGLLTSDQTFIFTCESDAESKILYQRTELVP